MLQLVNGCSLGSNSSQMCNSWLRLKFEGSSGRDENAYAVRRLIFGCAWPTEKPLNPFSFFRLELIFPRLFWLWRSLREYLESNACLRNTQNMDVTHNHEYYTSLFARLKLLTLPINLSACHIIAMKSFCNVSNLRPFAANIQFPESCFECRYFPAIPLRTTQLVIKLRFFIRFYFYHWLVFELFSLSILFMKALENFLLPFSKRLSIQRRIPLSPSTSNCSHSLCHGSGSA